MLNNGWIKLHRKIEDWHGFNDVIKLGFFIHLIVRANWEDKIWQGMTIKRGSFVTSVSKLADETGLSQRQTRYLLAQFCGKRFGKRMSNDVSNELSIETTPNYSVISINNYDMYQDIGKRFGKPCVTKVSNDLATTKEEDKNIRIKNILCVEKYTTTFSLNDEVIGEIARQYSVNQEQVKLLRDKLVGYCEANGKSYKNYKAALQNWVRNDIEKGTLKIIKIDPFYEKLREQERGLGNVGLS